MTIHGLPWTTKETVSFFFFKRLKSAVHHREQEMMGAWYLTQIWALKAVMFSAFGWHFAGSVLI